jgi:hypothetical protein
MRNVLDIYLTWSSKKDWFSHGRDSIPLKQEKAELLVLPFL